MKELCPDTLVLEDDGVSYICERKRGHGGKHRERFYGNDGKAYIGSMKWKRDKT